MTALTVPKLSMSGEPVRVFAWLVEDGAEVTRGQVVAELETEKATFELEAPADGTLRIVVESGNDADVGAVLATIDDGLDVAPPPVSTEAVQPAPVASAVTPVRERVSVGGNAASPAARRLAREHGVDLETLRGSGPGGRITAADVVGAGPRTDGDGALRDRVVAGITASWQEIPHIHIGGRIDADGLAAVRRPGSDTTVTDLIAFALARALLEVPELNGIFTGTAQLSSAVHLSLAVSTPGGVVAPTIRDAHERSLPSLAAERRRLVEAARSGGLDKRELGGGTVTLSNLGAYPVDFFAPVIAGPQICLVATGRLVQEPVAVDGMLAFRHRFWANAAIDHRAADGEAGARLLAALEQQLASLSDLVDVQEEA